MSIFDINPEDNVTPEYLIEKGFVKIYDSTDVYVYNDAMGTVRYCFNDNKLHLIIRDNQLLLGSNIKNMNFRSLWTRTSYKSNSLICIHYITDRGLFDMLFEDFEKMVNYLRNIF